MSADAIGEALAACYREIDATAMRDAPICNAALHVTAIGFREYQSYAVGVILSPWFLNLVVPEIGPGAAPAGCPAVAARQQSTEHILSEAAFPFGLTPWT
jgi:[NiFe] hydrogenase assembly HybE family chaperone